MVRPSKVSVSAGSPGWDSALQANLETIFDAPLPIFQEVDWSTLTTDYPAAQYEDCLAVTADTGNLYMSDGSAWQQIETAASNGVLNVVAKTGAYTVTTADDVVVCDSSGGAFTITLFTAVGNTGKVLTIKKTDSSSNAVTVDGASSETIDGATTVGIVAQNDAVKIVSDGTEWWII